MYQSVLGVRLIITNYHSNVVCKQLNNIYPGVFWEILCARRVSYILFLCASNAVCSSHLTFMLKQMCL